MDNKISREKIKKIASEKGITYQKACIIHFEIDGFFKTRKANNMLAEIELKVPSKQKHKKKKPIRKISSNMTEQDMLEYTVWLHNETKSDVALHIFYTLKQGKFWR